MNRSEIAIVGGGIAGLTAAIAFAARGVGVTVIEQAPQFEAVGAGLQLSPNATRILDMLGLMPAIERRWREIEHVALVSGRNLRHIARIPAGSIARRRWGAAYGVILRSDLQDILAGAARALPDCRILTGRPVASGAINGLRAEIADAIGTTPALIVGADGIWSKVRQSMAGHGRARFSGNVAWRLMADRAHIPEHLVETCVTTAFLGPSAHLVAYPLATGKLVNLVAVTHGRANADGAARAEIDRAFARWHPALRRLAAASREPSIWPLYEIENGPWQSGSDVILIGDAAHAMMPFSAQGAAMAIEDAFELAETWVAGGDLRMFVSARKARIDRVRSRTDFNRFAYHARGPIRIGRDVVLAMRTGESLAGDLDWLYGYRPERADRHQA